MIKVSIITFLTSALVSITNVNVMTIAIVHACTFSKPFPKSLTSQVISNTPINNHRDGVKRLLQMTYIEVVGATFGNKGMTTSLEVIGRHIESICFYADVLHVGRNIHFTTPYP